jgi:D-inositol-3-phosphate glycosyltransferase
VPTWFAAADAAVLPYRSATGSAVAAQALGWGLPLVGSAVGGIAEVVEEGVNGLLVPPEAPEALAGALARIADESLRARLAEGARAASRRWNWSSYAELLVDLTARIAAKSAAGSRDG